MKFYKGQVLRLNAKISLSNQPSYGCGTVSVLPGEDILFLEDFESCTPMQDYHCYMWPVLFKSAVKWFFWYVYPRVDSAAHDHERDLRVHLERISAELSDGVFTAYAR